ncbi:MAG: biopolymer transporter ExbD [bacterium]|nr:biopolymer transporter ExbD [bacterium]
MADVVFLLIVFFVLTYQVDLDPTRVELPESHNRIEVTKNAAIISIAPPSQQQVIRVSTGKEKSMRVHSDDEIASFALNVLAADPDQHFIIKADHRVKYERIDTVIETLKAARAEVIFLLSEQKTQGP